MVFKWKNKDEELPMSIERADYERPGIQWGTAAFAFGLGMIFAIALLAWLSTTLPPL